MKIDEFIEANNRLETYFQKEYTTEQRKIMYEELKTITIERYRKVIAGCIRSCKNLPKVADILKTNMEIIENNNINDNREKFECNKCSGTGYVIYTKIIKEGNNVMPYTYAARCVCQNAMFANKKIPVYTKLGIEISNRENQVKDTIRDINQIKKQLIKNF